MVQGIVKEVKQSNLNGPGKALSSVGFGCFFLLFSVRLFFFAVFITRLTISSNKGWSHVPCPLLSLISFPSSKLLSPSLPRSRFSPVSILVPLPPLLSASSPLFLSIVLPVFRGLVNKPFKPHLLCSLITHAIFIHGCHSCRHIKAIIPSLLSSSHSFLCSPSLISSSSLLSFLLSCPLSSFCLPLPFSPTSSLPSLAITHSISRSIPICTYRKSETSSVFSCDQLRGTAVKTVYLFIEMLCAGSAY